LIGAENLSPDTKLVAGTGAVSRYNFNRSRELVTMQDFNCVQMRVSGFKMLNEFIWPAEYDMKIKDQKKKKVRAHTQHTLFARLAFTNLSKECDKQLTHIVRVRWS